MGYERGIKVLELNGKLYKKKLHLVQLFNYCSTIVISRVGGKIELFFGKKSGGVN